MVLDLELEIPGATQLMVLGTGGDLPEHGLLGGTRSLGELQRLFLFPEI